ncbi:hypothetical protein ACXEI5_002578 [Klebsiella quasipneumoniae]
MAWLGIPFPLEKVEGTLFSNYQFSHLTIDKLPSVVVDSSFSWETLLSAIIAGAIPAWIAYKAIRSNNELATYQNKLQAKTKINEEIRMAAADYVTAVHYISVEYSEWIKGLVNRRVAPVSELKLPENIQENIYKAELSKNALMLLVKPNEAGKVLLSHMAEIKLKLGPVLEVHATQKDILNLQKAASKFILACHEYFDK